MWAEGATIATSNIKIENYVTLAAKLDHPDFEKEREFVEVKFVFGRIFVSLSIDINFTSM